MHSHTKNNVYKQSCLLAFFLLFISGFCFAQSPQVINLPLSKPGEPIYLEMGILSADITVIGEKRNDVEFTITASGSGRKIITPSGTKNLNGTGYGLDISEDDNHISFDTDWRVQKIKVIAKVPQRANLELSTVNDGSILVENIIGSLQLENVNGPITATNISGSVIAEAINEDITISFSKLNKDDGIAIASINGDIYFKVPAKAGVELHLDTLQGEIISDFEVELKPSNPVIKRDDRGDGVSVKVENSIIATINGGGPIAKINTMNGNIQIGKSNED